MDALHELVEFVKTVGVCEAKHRPTVGHLLKIFDEPAANPLGGTVGVSVFRMCGFEVLKLA